MQIVADLHTHTNVSHHAFNSLDEMCLAAAKKGHVAIGITNHGPAMSDGAHRWHFGNYKILPEIIHGVRLLGGAELNILPGGQIDEIPKAYLRNLDIIISSFHETCFQPKDKTAHTEALEAMLENPFVMVLGHLGNPAYEFDMEYIISKCNEYDTMVELNASSPKSRRGCEENCFKIATLCKKYGVPVFLNSDSHSIYTVGEVSVAAKIAEEARIHKDQIINADTKTLADYFKRKRNIDILAR